MNIVQTLYATSCATFKYTWFNWQNKNIYKVSNWKDKTEQSLHYDFMH